MLASLATDLAALLSAVAALIAAVGVPTIVRSQRRTRDAAHRAEDSAARAAATVASIDRAVNHVPPDEPPLITRVCTIEQTVRRHGEQLATIRQDIADLAELQTQSTEAVLTRLERIDGRSA